MKNYIAMNIELTTRDGSRITRFKSRQTQDDGTGAEPSAHGRNSTGSNAQGLVDAQPMLITVSKSPSGRVTGGMLTHLTLKARDEVEDEELILDQDSPSLGGAESRENFATSSVVT